LLYFVIYFYYRKSVLSRLYRYKFYDYCWFCSSDFRSINIWYFLRTQSINFSSFRKRVINILIQVL
jgi:hypothetical protein